MRSHDNEKIFKEKDNTGRTFSNPYYNDSNKHHDD
jgi:hypothetical protein